MTMRSTSSRILIAAYTFLAQCSPSQMPPVGASFESALEFTAGDPAFTPGLGILSGFDQPCNEARWDDDTWVLLGVKVEHESKSDIWFVRLSTLPNKAQDEVDDRVARAADADAPRMKKFALPIGVGPVKAGKSFVAPIGRVLVEMFDQQGNFVRSSVRHVPRKCPTASLLDLCATASQADNVTREEFEGVIPLMTTLQPLGTARALRPIREAARAGVIKKPTVLGFVLSGLKMNMQTDFDDTRLMTERWAPGLDLGPLYNVEMPVEIAGQRVFNCRMVVGSSAPPYNLTAGVLLMEIVHPDKPANRMSVRVLAAQRFGQDEEESSNDSTTLAKAR